jgi:hypothetical protein
MIMTCNARPNSQKEHVVSLVHICLECSLNLANTAQSLGHSMVVPDSSFITRIDEGHGSGLVSAQPQHMIMPRVRLKGTIPEYLFYLDTPTHGTKQLHSCLFPQFKHPHLCCRR